MNELESQVRVQNEDEIDFLALCNILWKEKLIICFVVSVFAMGAIVFALLQTEIYRAELLLAPVNSEQSTNSLLSQFGAAPGLGGISVPSESNDKISISIATVQSREFLKNFIEAHNLLVPLMASKWDKNTGQSIVDQSIYDSTTNSWVGQPPSDQKAFNAFSRILSISEGRNNSLVTLAIEWHNPVEAKDWANWLIQDINNLIVQKDIEEASSAIAYLQNQLQLTQLVEMQRVFYELIESQTRILMLAEIRSDYVFRIIDPAVVPEERIRPNRSRIVIFGTLLGGLLAVLLVFVHHAYQVWKLNER